MSNDAAVPPQPNQPSVDQSDRTGPDQPAPVRPDPGRAADLHPRSASRPTGTCPWRRAAGGPRSTTASTTPAATWPAEDGGAMAEYDALVNHVTLWNVAVERQIQVKGPDAEAFVNFVITRDATKIPVDARPLRDPLQRGGRHPQRPGAAAGRRGRVLVQPVRLRPVALAAGGQRRASGSTWRSPRSTSAPCRSRAPSRST